MSRLPYPHAFNDCAWCREVDADFQLSGEPYDLPGRRPSRFCRGCVGPALVTVATSRPGDTDIAEPFTVTFTTLLPGRTS